MVAVDVLNIPKVAYRQECDRANPNSCLDDNLTTLQEKIFRQKIGNEQSVGEIDFIFQQNAVPRREWRFIPNVQSRTTFVFRGELPQVMPKATVLIGGFLPEFGSSVSPAVLGIEVKTSVFPDVQETQEEVEEALLRGVQPMDYQYKVLFSQEVEVKTSELRSWEPTFVFNSNLYDDDE